VLGVILVVACCGPTEPRVEPVVPTSTVSLPVPLCDTLNGSGEVERTLLTYEELMQPGDPEAPIDDGAFALPVAAARPEHTFEGRLELHGEEAEGDFTKVTGGAKLPPGSSHLPEFDYAFVQCASHLVPVRRGLITTDHPTWDLILEPGRVWHEVGDRGYSRATFPFALVWKGSNATFNGVMGFLFDHQHVSQVWYQITQETTASLRADFWGLLDATYHPETVGDPGRVRGDYASELAQRFPAKPLEEMEVDYTGVDLSAFGRGVTPEHMTGYGVIVNGVNYVPPCRTRYGQYAYCDQMRMPSYSTAKSIFAAGALMRLAQKFEQPVGGLLIKDYLPEIAGAAGDWGRVTFDHTLDMATGNYRSSAYMADEDSRQPGDFWDTDSYSDRMAAALYWPHSARPGTRWVYHTSDTFVVVRAMQNYLKSRQGPDADLWSFFAGEVLAPIHVGPGASSSGRAPEEGGPGQAYGGYGLWWTHDDVAKISVFLNNQHGAIGGEQLLAPDLLDDALQRDARDRGVEIVPGMRYNDGFWAQRFGRAQGFDCVFWVPHMLGYSGVVIALIPNGTTYYYFSDNREFTWSDAVKALDAIIPICP
jgi:hypothetical protein